MNKKFLTFCISVAFIFPVSNFAFALEGVPSAFAEEKFSTSNVDKNKFECEVNCCFSIGQICKSAYHIQRHGKRFQASPLDWMRDYSLDTALHLFKTKFQDFFEEIYESESWPHRAYRNINDAKNHILSVHYFLKSIPVYGEEHQKFRKMMLNRANKVDDILNQSDSIALVYSQENKDSFMPSNDKLIEFLKGFAEMYPGKKIYLIVVRNSEVEGIQKRVTFEENNLKIIEFTFSDIGINWTGNHTAWDEVINHIKLVRKP